MNVFTVVENSGTIIADIELGISTAEAVYPLAVATEQAIVAQFKAPIVKMKADIQAMPEKGHDLKAIVGDVETFFADALGIVEGAEGVIELAKAKGDDAWRQLAGAAGKIKVDFAAMGGTATVANPVAV